MVDQPATDDQPNDRRRERLFDRRYRLLELRERRLDRKAKYAELEINRQLRLSEIQATEGRGVRFTSSQATVAAAVIALLSGVFGATIQGFVTRNVEADKNAAVIAVEKLKAEGSLELEQQKQTAVEQLERAKFETTLILKATEAPNREDQIKNLKFFLNAGFIHDPEGKIAKIDEKAYPSTQIAEPTTPSDIYRNARTSVGKLTNQYVSDNGISRIIEGTCFIISRDGFALAAAHIVASDGAKENQSVVVRLGSIAAQPLEAAIIDVNKDLGLALLKLPASLDYTPLRISRQLPAVGDSVALVGFPAGGDTVMLLGSVTTSSNEKGNFEIATPASSGQSSSPVFDQKGAVIGIIWGAEPETLRLQSR